MTKVGKAALALMTVAVVAVAVVSGGSAAPQATVTIGWAYDGVGNMAPFDGPALATAKAHIASSQQDERHEAAGSSPATRRATSRRSRRRARGSSSARAPT